MNSLVCLLTTEIFPEYYNLLNGFYCKICQTSRKYKIVQWEIVKIHVCISWLRSRSLPTLERPLVHSSLTTFLPPTSKYTFTFIWVHQSLAVLYNISTCVHNSPPFLKVVHHETPSGCLRSLKKKKKGKDLVTQSCLALCNSMDCSPSGSLVHGILQARILEWGSHSLLQRIFLTQGLNPGLLHSRQFLYRLSHQGSSLGSLDSTGHCLHDVFSYIYIHTYIPMIQFSL